MVARTSRIVVWFGSRIYGGGANMKKSFLLFSLILTISALAPAASIGRAVAQEISNVQSEFKMPPANYSGAPFWSWDEKLVPDEMRLQIDELDAGGFSGFFMHARQGRITPYLSDEWMNDVRISVDRAKKNGMLAYLYDEDRWPSGFAGGIVLKMNPEFRQKALYLYKTEKPLTPDQFDPEWRIIRVFSAKISGVKLISYKDVTPKTGTDVPAPAKDETLLYFLRVYAKPSLWFNNNTYIDTMNPAAVDAFIDSTYEAYYKAVGDEFGKTVPAIFTDEPCFIMNGSFPSPSIAWTDALPDVFRSKYGYALEDRLPSLFYETDGFKKARLDYWTSVTELFRDSYGRRLFDWSAKHNIQFTGHYMSEDTLESQLRWIGAAMPMYEYMQRPGMDHLGRNINDVLTAKQLSSAAHQFDRPQTLTELYGCSGWNVSLENMKWIADWHYALGVNFLNEHLAWYTMRGCRKRDYPATIHYQSPWWRYHKTLGDYVRRASFITAQGKFVADTLVLHPITSAWAVYSPLDSGEVNLLNSQFTTLIMFLSSNQVDYDLGDEIIISRHGRVEGDKFIVGKMAYTSVIIPPGVTLRGTTVKLLLEFIDAGGKVVTISGLTPAPSLIDATEPLHLKGAFKASSNQIALNKLLPVLEHHVAMIDNKGAPATSIYLNQHEIGSSKYFFFANTDQNNGVETTVALPCAGRVRSWNLFTGEVEDYPAKVSGGKTTIALHFEPAGSALISVSPTEKPVDVTTPEQALARSVDLPSKWRIVGSDPNAVTLDFISYRREGDADWSMSVPQYTIQESLESKGTGTKFSIRYFFNIGFDPKNAKELWFVMEQPDRYQIKLNGKPIRYTDQGWWRDRFFKKIDIRDAAVEGRNVFEANATFVEPTEPKTMNYTENGIEVEAAYVVGDFSVRNETGTGYVMNPPIDEINYGDLVKHGFPFFSGSISVAQDVDIQPAPGETVRLELDGLEAITTLVKVNGKVAGLIAFHPHYVDITPYVKPGLNHIEIELTDSNRNLMGPHHNMEKEPLSVGPGSFKETISRKYNFVPFGITKGARLEFYK
jgi:hypothetical protein